MRPLHFLLFAVSGLIATTAFAAAEQVSLTPVDMIETPRLSAPALSPSGDKLLFLRSSTNWRENKSIRRFHLHDLVGDEELPVFEPENEKESFSRGYWAPDSSGFVTIMERKDDENDQAYLYSLATGELKRLTEHEEDVEDVAWSPGGQSFFFRAERAPEENVKRLRKKNWLIRDYEERSPGEVWRYDMKSGEADKVIGGDYFVRNYDLSPDGSHIIHMRAPGGLIDDSHRGELWLTNLATGEETQLTANQYRESGAQLSPNNETFAFIATVNARGDAYYEDNLFIQRVGSANPQLLMPDEALEVLDFAWDKDGTGLFVLGNIGVRTELYHYTLVDESLTRLTEGDHAVGAWSYNPTGDTHVAIIADANNPGEIYIMHDPADGFKIATGEYEDWNARFKLPTQEAVQWRGRGGVTIEGLLVYPVDYQSGTAFPLVTVTHGGPRSSSQFGSWQNSRYISVLAGQGYGVFLPNHRGGTGYGDKFMRDMVGGYFRNAHHDVLDGIDALIERGLADPDQLIKMGWSAGGHMTTKLITITDRFKAASSGAGASDWVSMYGESDVRYSRTPWFGGAPWEKNAPIRSFARQSMLKDAWRVKTPTLFFAGAEDVRVPPTQSIMMYRGLKAAGTDTQFYLAPEEPHGFRKPSHRLFKINRELQWFSKYVLGKPYDPVLPPAALEDDEDDDKEDDKECSCEE